MNRSEIFDKLKDMISEHSGLDVSEMTEKSGFIEDLGMDSLNVIEMVMEIEDRLDIEISDEEWDNGGVCGGKVKTVGEAVYLIEKLLQ